MKKRVITFLIALLVLSSTLVVAVGARTVGYGLTFRPYINYTVTTDYGVTFSPPTVSEDNIVDTFRLNGGGVTMSNVVFSTSDTTVIYADDVLTSFDYCYSTIKYDFDNALVTDENGDSYPPDISGFDIRYDPFTVTFDNMFERVSGVGNKVGNIVGIPLYDSIRASFAWGGGASAYVSSTVLFRLSYVTKTTNTAEGFDEYNSRTNRYELFYSGEVNSLFDSSAVDIADVSVRDVTNDVSMSWETFLNDINNKTAVMRDYYGDTVGDTFFDVEDMMVSIYAVNAPFTYLSNDTVFVSEDGFVSSNGLFWDEQWGYRQQMRGSYIAVMASNVLNRRAVNDLADSQGTPSALTRVILLFLGAVVDFFAIDFFGLGITIGHLIGLMLMVAVVLVFLKFFAGG